MDDLDLEYPRGIIEQIEKSSASKQTPELLKVIILQNARLIRLLDQLTWK